MEERGGGRRDREKKRSRREEGREKWERRRRRSRERRERSRSRDRHDDRWKTERSQRSRRKDEGRSRWEKPPKRRRIENPRNNNIPLSNPSPYPTLNHNSLNQFFNNNRWRRMRERIPIILAREDEVGGRPREDPESPISFLPEEVMCEVLTRLPLRVLRVCAEVCHYWRKLSHYVESHPSPFTPVEIEVIRLHNSLDERRQQLQQQGGDAESVRGRRWRMLEELMEEGEYFSVQGMKVRDPFIYQELIDAPCAGRGFDVLKRFPSRWHNTTPTLNNTLTPSERLLWWLSVGEANVAVARHREEVRRKREGGKRRCYWGALEDEGDEEEIERDVYPRDDFVYQQAFQRQEREAELEGTGKGNVEKGKEKEEGEEKKEEREGDETQIFMEGRYSHLLAEMQLRFMWGEDWQHVSYDTIDNDLRLDVSAKDVEGILSCGCDMEAGCWDWEDTYW